ncbi:MAG: septal ring lytic transglycosylase RlpA family protein [Candidatus Rokubacteria bacterium]|nr:septal ring lytic transglycosylase RlpA family protein [Candidatus Rokubacteria bacterium]
MRRTLRAGSIFAILALLAGCAVLSGGPAADDARERERLAARAAAAAARSRAEVASWYGAWHHGRPTASGEAFHMHALTAAHRSLPLGVCVEVVHLRNGRRVFVRVNDRGPYIPGRAIDLSYGAARELNMVEDGLARVRILQARPDLCEESRQS